MHHKHILINQEAWDKRTEVHIQSKFYNVPAFLQGECTLNQPELEIIRNINNKSLLHLQCHFGLDSLSWARKGAKVTGIDFSPKAIQNAKLFAHQLNLNTNFIEADVHNVIPFIEVGSYDYVFSSYGVICWLSDLASWAHGIAASLREGGRFVLIEFHPILDLLYNGKVSGFIKYFNQNEPLQEKTTGTYTDPNAHIEYEECRWQHPISEIMQCLLEVKLRLVSFKEYPYCPYKIIPDLDCQENENWISSQNINGIPYLYSLEFEKCESKTKELV